eukprot:m51a1_g10468 hypothetical protein (199) ;mRNA; f:49910-63659
MLIFCTYMYKNGSKGRLNNPKQKKQDCQFKKKLKRNETTPVQHEAMAAAAAPVVEPKLSPEPQQQQDNEPEKVNEQLMEQDKKTELQDSDTEQQDDAEAKQQDEKLDEQEENVRDEQQDQGDEDDSDSLLVPAQQQVQIIKGLEAARAKLKEKITTYKKEQLRVTNDLHEQHVLIVMLKSQNEGLKEQLELLKSDAEM